MSCEDGITLNDSKTFFSEYILEHSDATDYFNKHVVGFTFTSNTSNEDDKRGNMDSTVWYSNSVSTWIALCGTVIV